MKLSNEQIERDVYNPSVGTLYEWENIFQKYWIFAGLKTYLPNNYDYMSRTLAGINFVIQRKGEAFISFRNYCPHRGVRLFTKEFGNAKLTCPFHGWSFSEDLSGRFQ